MSTRVVCFVLLVCALAGALVGLVMGGARLSWFVSPTDAEVAPALWTPSARLVAATPLVTARATPSPTSTPTVTVAPVTPTATASEVPRPTATRALPTETPRREPTGTPTPLVGLHGISAQLRLREGRATYAAGEQFWLDVQGENRTDRPITFGILGFKVERDGAFKTTWSKTVIDARARFRAEDTLSLSAAGSYTITLAICFSPTENCSNPGADWEEFLPGVVVVIR